MSFLTICISLFVIASLYFFLKDYLNVFSKAEKINSEVEPKVSSASIVETEVTTKRPKKEKSPVKFLKEVETVGKKSTKKTNSTTTAKSLKNSSAKVAAKVEKKPKLKTPKSVEVAKPISKRGRKKK